MLRQLGKQPPSNDIFIGYHLSTLNVSRSTPSSARTAALSHLGPSINEGCPPAERMPVLYDGFSKIYEGSSTLKKTREPSFRLPELSQPT